MDDEKLMQIVRITVDGITYPMFAPVICQNDEEVGEIQDLEFGEIVVMKHIVSCLLHGLNNTVQ
jgi:hypothetical protein